MRICHHSRIAAALTVAVLAAVVGGASGSASASSLVPLTVHLIDTAGAPLAGVPVTVTTVNGAQWAESATTGADGSAVLSAIPSSIATFTLAYPPGQFPVMSMPAVLGHSVRLTGGFLPAAAGIAEPVRVQAPVPTPGGDMTVRLPPVQTYTVHVVTEAGQDVSGAKLVLGQTMSSAVPAAGTTPAYRIGPNDLDINPYSQTTGSDGVVALTTYQLEPDEAIWLTHLGSDPARPAGQAPGPYVSYQPKPTATLQMPVGYPAFVTTAATVVLPFVPVLTTPAATQGVTAGSATVSATLQQPTATGPNGPLAGQPVQAWAEDATAGFAAAAPRLLGQATSDAAGRVSIPVSIGGPTRVVLHLASGSHVAAAVNATPRPQRLMLNRVSYNPPGADRPSRASLNGEWFTVRNAGAVAVSTEGLRVRNRHGQLYRFPHMTLRPGATLRVHTGPGKRHAHELFWGAHKHRWSNRADRAQLLDARSRVLDSCSWPPLGSHGVVRC